MQENAYATAEEQFDDAVDAVDGSDAAALQAELARRAEEAERMADPWMEERLAQKRATTRSALQESFASPEGPPDPETAKRVATILRKTSRAVGTSMKGATIETMEDGIAGKGQLDSDKMWIDPLKAKRENPGGDVLIDVAQAEDTKNHELEHNRQSATADAEQITVPGATLEAWEVREAGSISVQKRVDFLCTRYKQIHALLPVNEAERELIRQGRFRELEARKNGRRVPEPSLN